jgi:16S rRNA (cytosine967-C5)-methyltransferase
MGVTLSRRIAFEILLRVAKTSSYAGPLLYDRLDKRVGREDAALATELTLGVLRQQRQLDFLLAPHLKKPLDSLDREVLIALRIGLYQLRFLERVPAHAAVNESVELVRRARKHSAAGLVNVVLRNSVKKAREPLVSLMPADSSPAERLGILYSHPTWLVKRWLAAFGEARSVALLESNNRPPQVSCVVPDFSSHEAVVTELTKGGAKIEPGNWLRGAFQISGVNLAALAPFRQGKAMIQDEASQMVAHLLDAARGASVLDLCAAPGGKTALVATSAARSAQIIAADLHPNRLLEMRERISRAGLSNIDYVGLNATRPLPFLAEFDRVLADAPCSGTGTLARNPEIRWRLEPGDLGELHERQVKLLMQALNALAPRGRLVYSTCSLEAEENESVVEATLAGSADFRLVSGETELAPHLKDSRAGAMLFDAGSFFRTFPPEHHTDGFFAAVIERKRAGKD